MKTSKWTTSTNTGSKVHLKSYRGIKRNSKGKLIAVLNRNTMGPQSTACGLIKDAETFIYFHELVKSCPDDLCKTCKARYDELMKEYRALRKIANN